MSDAAAISVPAPFGLDQAAKERCLAETLAELTQHHMANCPAYQRMLAGLGFELQKLTCSSARQI